LRKIGARRSLQLRLSYVGQVGEGGLYHPCSTSRSLQLRLSFVGQVGEGELYHPCGASRSLQLRLSYVGQVGEGGQIRKMYVYLLKSISNPDKHYVGITEDIDERLSRHNSGRSPHTSEYRPWEIVVTFDFPDQAKAHTFEKYLKTGSGRAFLHKHFL
jgi:predicted GIY-YIG superfamily endonuclease